MAMTAAVKDELSRLVVTKPCCRRSEVAALLRFAGGLHIVGGRVVVEAEVDTGSVARRLRREIHELYGHQCEAHVIAAGGLRRGARYVMRVVRDGEGLARQTGLLDARGRPVRGLPPPVVSGGVCDAEAAWRGAFLAHGSLTEPGRSSALEVTCPGQEAAMALVGAARQEVRFEALMRPPAFVKRSSCQSRLRHRLLDGAGPPGRSSLPNKSTGCTLHEKGMGLARSECERSGPQVCGYHSIMPCRRLRVARSHRDHAFSAQT